MCSSALLICPIHLIPPRFRGDYLDQCIFPALDSFFPKKNLTRAIGPKIKRNRILMTTY